MKKKQIYIAWIAFQRRANSMNEYIDFDLHYVPPPFSSKWLKPLGYVLQSLRTIGIVLRARPDTVWVQSPPAFVTHLLLGLRTVRRFGLLVDCHDAVMLPPWSKFPGAVWVLNHSDGVIVHNAEMRPAAEAMGVRPELIRVLEDPPSVLEGAKPATDESGPYVLVPCSFNEDEHQPIRAVLGAARLMPDVTFRITGRRRKAEALGLTAEAPGNVFFTDYLTVAEFERLLLGAAVVLGITTRENCQLSVANEALGAHAALVLSDTGLLRAMFGAAALFTKNTAESMADVLGNALARRPELEARSEALKISRQSSWMAAARAASRINGQEEDLAESAGLAAGKTGE